MSLSMPPHGSQSSESTHPKSPLNLLSGGLFAALHAAAIAAPTMGGVTGPFWVHMMIVLIALFGALIIWFELIPHRKVRHKLLSTIFVVIAAIAYDRMIIASRDHTAALSGNLQRPQPGAAKTPTSPEVTEPSPATAQSDRSTAMPNHQNRDGEPVRGATVADGVRALLREELQVDESKIKPQSDLVLDLGATPLDVSEIVMQLETSYDVKITSSEAKKLKSVQDLIDCVEKKTAKTSTTR
jgi:acyl carrier protein